MSQTIETVIESDGRIALWDPLRFPLPRRALVTISDDNDFIAAEGYLLSESSLAHDWNRPEEDAAWSHLQPAK